jgi:hypothetical protein
MAYAVAGLLNKQAAGSCAHELNDRENLPPNPLKDLWRGPAPENHCGPCPAHRTRRRPDAQALDVAEHGTAARLTREPVW